MSDFRKYKNTTVFGENAYKNLNKFLAKKSYSKVFFLCDENTQKHCIPYLLQRINNSINSEIIEIESGEENKDIATCQQLWKVLSDLDGDRNSVVLNLGGGVITDMGGFVAATFLRGIDFINIPTTLLAMVDASIGGKTGINRANLKNQIGLFKKAVFTLIDVNYLNTLPQNQMRSGLAEMLKHGLIADKSYWNKLSDLSQLTLEDLENLVKKSIEIKTKITSKDQQESGIRKILNFGHTLGHAIESFCLENENKKTLLHGEAVAIGLILEAYLSYQTSSLSKTALNEIKEVVSHSFKPLKFTTSDIGNIINLLKFDKKNNKGIINFVLLQEIGSAIIDCQVSEELIYDAFQFYQT